MTDRQWAYVAASRHRKELRMFVPTELADELTQKLARSRQKEVATDFTLSSTPPQKSAERGADLAFEMEW
jgi:ATP-dependent exoDNAse (exonuclease V) alpha subunit